MLFNSYTYLLLFLPLTLLVFQLLRRAPFRVRLGWLVAMSLLYYGWWKPQYLPLILGSCVANYFFGRFLSRHREKTSGKWMLALGVAANLSLLGYFKYTGLFAATLQGLSGWPENVPSIFLPLAISFFTFQQIAYLVDAFRGEADEYHFTDYLLFVTFFPQLIAGPIVHHKEMMPQFMRHHRWSVRWNDLAVGITFLAIGLFKKVVIADAMARIATPIFSLSGEDSLRDPTMAEAWSGAISYAMQIYFDFSGYSDMALGSARLFGIRLPLNFHSPYKAASVIEFWRRWHITLSRFLRDYLYIPLGGNRLGKSRRYGNLMFTMLLGGLWHGAGWTFLAWGGLHGLFLCLNHGWMFLRKNRGLPPVPRPLAVGLTFLAVTIAWVFFRAESFDAAGRMLRAMSGLGGLSGWPTGSAQVVNDSRALRFIPWLAVAWFLPNTQQFLRRYRPAVDLTRFDDLAPDRRRWWHWRPTLPWLAFTLALLYAVGREFDQLSEFIYFQF